MAAPATKIVNSRLREKPDRRKTKSITALVNISVCTAHQPVMPSARIKPTIAAPLVPNVDLAINAVEQRVIAPNLAVKRPITPIMAPPKIVDRIKGFTKS